LEGGRDDHGGQYPNPTEQVAPKSARLRQWPARCVKHPDVPCLHGQSLTLGPKPSEVNGKNQKKKSLKAMAVVKGVFGLAQGAKQIARDEHNPKEQHAFVQPTSHSSGQGGRHEGEGFTGQVCWRCCHNCIWLIAQLKCLLESQPVWGGEFFLSMTMPVVDLPVFSVGVDLLGKRMTLLAGVA